MAAKKPKLPYTVMIDGVRHKVVHEITTMDGPVWTEQLPSGQLVHHAGKILTGQTVGKWLDKPRPCSRCKQPCQTTTPLGRPVHDTCEGWLHILPDDLEAQIVFGVAADLGASMLTPATPARKETRRAA